MKLTVSVGPHIEADETPRAVMLAVILALSPALLAAVYFFKLAAVKLILACVAGSVISEAGFQYLRWRKVDLRDLSAVVTGLLLAFCLPPGSPLGVAVLGSIVAIGLGKQIFGGLGHNIFNPALVGRAFLAAAFPALLTTWVEPYTLDAVTRATPLGLAKFEHIYTPLSNLFWGNTAGSLGETSSFALIIGGVFLFLRRDIDWQTPLGIFLSVFIFGGLFWLIDSTRYPSALFQLFSGGLMLAALFMATDPVTSPITPGGRWVFGLGIGIITVVIRLWGGLPEGVMYAILFMNAWVPLINRYTRPRRFGT
jgi:electron transport complex protein RnfD